MKTGFVRMLFFCLVGGCVVSHAEARPMVVAYVPNWVNLTTFSQRIDYGKLTHINLAFENPVDDDGNLSFNTNDVVLVDKAHAQKVRILISIGGGAASTNKKLMARYFNLLSQTNRNAFASKLADYVVAHDFDGLDVDIEGPSINSDYGAFIDVLSKALKARGRLLTAALSKGYGGDKIPGTVFEHLDFVNVMAYDEKGTWTPNSPGQHSSIQFARENVDYWMFRGVVKSKLVLGVPFYGYGFGNAFRNHSYAYAEILAKYPDAEKVDRIGDTIWYNGIPTIKEKSQFVLDAGLAGMMIWSLDDDVPGEKSLLLSIDSVFSKTMAVKPAKPGFNVIAFYTGKSDVAHVSFVGEARRWFANAAENYNFTFTATNNWNCLNNVVLSNYQVVVFLDARPEVAAQREAFEHYMKNGGAWLGFHFAAFALNPSAVPQNWDWYHNEFLGSGSYVGNTWRPTPARLKVENRGHPAVRNLPEVFSSAPNEWYQWSNNLRRNTNITILLSIDPSSFPLGTGPKPQEIWHEGDCPVVWANRNYRMIYVNMGHNDIDYEHGTNRELSFSFDNPVQDRLIINSILWLGSGR